MQRVRPTHSRRQAIFTLIGILLVLTALVWTIQALLGPRPATTVIAYPLPCQYNDSLRPFGSNVLYYDGVSIHCMSGTGSVRWSFQIGSNAGFDCSDQIIAAWASSTIYILDQAGNSTYNDNLGETIQFARVGDKYVAVVISDSSHITRPRLIVKDHTGAHMDEESDAYENLIILDVGFYGKNGEYMWTLALDVFGTAANTILNTFEVGKMNTGTVSLGENITYGILYENSKLRVISTRKMKTFSYRGTEDVSQSVLVYGWRLIDSEVPSWGDALLLFAPTAQTENQFDIRELRLINGANDQRYSLPSTCIGAVVWNRTMYAISDTKLYRASLGASRFTEYTLPIDKPATHYIGSTSNGRVLVACGDEVYLLTLPETR